jgi:hypothetical protein
LGKLSSSPHHGSLRYDDGAGPLRDARALHRQVVGLIRLLELQMQQIETLNERLYTGAPGEVAARRLLALKHAQASGARAA